MDAFDYPLPEAAIAQEPAEPRDAARLLVATDPTGVVAHRTVRDLPDLLGPGDVLVVNDTRVIPARLHLRKPTGGKVEVVLLERLHGDTWEALVRPSARVPAGTRLLADDQEMVEVGGAGEDGTRHVRVLVPLEDSDIKSEDSDIKSRAALALPPYIHRPLADPERYQTVYAAHPGSVAAPTAGLHLTEAVLAGCRQGGGGPCRGAGRRPRHLPPGQRPPARGPRDASRALPRPGSNHGGVPAGVAHRGRGHHHGAGPGVGRRHRELEGRTRLFIHGDYPFAVADALLTNFHLPRSSLLLLLDAFCGERWRKLYRLALEDGYRFLSFGDAMLVSRRPDAGR